MLVFVQFLKIADVGARLCHFDHMTQMHLRNGCEGSKQF